MSEPSTGRIEPVTPAELREVVLYGWVGSDGTRDDRPQDTSDAILVRTEGPSPQVRRQFRIGALDVAVIEGDAVDVEPLPAAKHWRGMVLGYVMSGEISITQGDNSVTLTAGNFVFYTGAQRYRITSPGPHEYLVVRIPTASIALRHSSFVDVIATDLSEMPSAHALRGILAALSLPQASPSIAASAHLGDAVVSATHAVIADARPPGSAKTMSLFNALVIWIESNLADPDLSAEKIAAGHYLSSRYIRKIFAANGTTVSAFIRQRRLERIRDYLVDPKLVHVPVHTIAAQWAMPDPATFSRAFSRQFGVSPHRYRTLHLLQGQEGGDDWAPTEPAQEEEESHEPHT